MTTSTVVNAINEEMQTFHLFPNLPVELRRKIWRRTPPLFPRIIEVRPRRDPGQPWDLLTTKHHVKATAPLVLLSINKEAREELLTFYTALSSDVTRKKITNLDLACPNPHEKPPMVNFDADSIFFNVAYEIFEKAPYLSFVRRLFQNFDQDKRRVRKLALNFSKSFTGDVVIWTTQNIDADMANVIGSLLHPCFHFNGLEELVHVVEHNHMRVDMNLVAFEDHAVQNHGMLDKFRGQEGQYEKEWRVPKIRYCITVAAPVDNRRIESQRSYLKRVYGEAFVEGFGARDRD